MSDPHEKFLKSAGPERPSAPDLSIPTRAVRQGARPMTLEEWLEWTDPGPKVDVIRPIRGRRR
jgi:hypothetical protein